MRRGALLAAGLAASAAVTATLWVLGVPGFFLVLAFPLLFLPRWGRGGSTGAPPRSAACPSCGAPRSGGHRFCPSCGSRFA